ncbi:thioesterase II family protein [Streptomyces sp. FH025]|uniref:thioesterase II family protein n=1 Tax=Streptomyces sp. FH025 TaxID=2815937 RepID=UPI001A9D139B|nr:alpha/beta fold hydrolase [Streptomyces sp. FH025]MBO1416425.1 thioesterase [Streptomyces sp. FH025]
MTIPFIRPRVVEDPELRLIGFHHAGGSGSAYFPLHKELPPTWELLLLDLPGRGKRYGQAPIEELTEAVELAVRDVLPWTDAPFALFGHSYGSLVALETARTLHGLGREPVWLGVSGRVPPSYRGRRKQLSSLPDGELLQELDAMGGLPEQLAEIPEFLDRFVRLTRADLRAVESFRPAEDRAVLGCPITVFCGTDDAWGPPEEMDGWGLETSAGHRRLVHRGGHFYFLGSAMPAFARGVVAEIESALATAGVPTTGGALR